MYSWTIHDSFGSGIMLVGSYQIAHIRVPKNKLYVIFISLLLSQLVLYVIFISLLLFEDIVCKYCNAKVLDASSKSCKGSQRKFKLILLIWKKKIINCWKFAFIIKQSIKVERKCLRANFCLNYRVNR